MLGATWGIGDGRTGRFIYVFQMAGAWGEYKLDFNIH